MGTWPVARPVDRSIVIQTSLCFCIACVLRSAAQRRLASPFSLSGIAARTEARNGRRWAVRRGVPLTTGRHVRCHRRVPYEDGRIHKDERGEHPAELLARDRCGHEDQPGAWRQSAQQQASGNSAPFEHVCVLSRTTTGRTVARARHDCSKGQARRMCCCAHPFNQLKTPPVKTGRVPMFKVLQPPQR